jgi:hypothetical protein
MSGRMLVELGRLGLAWDAFQKTRREAEAVAQTDKKYRYTAEAAQDELKDLEKLAGYVAVSVRDAGPGARVLIEGREKSLDELGDPIGVTPGKVRVVLVAATGKEIEREVEVEAGATVEADLSPPASEAAAEIDRDEAEGSESDVEASSKGVNKRTLAYVAGGIGVAGLVTFGVFGVLNNSKFSDLEDGCSGQVCPRALEDDAETGQTYQTLANVGLFVGAVGLGTGVTLFLLSREAESETPVASARVRLGPGTVSVRGRF